MARKRYSILPVFKLKLAKDRKIKYAFQVNSYEVAIQIFQAYLGNEAVEHMAVLMMDGQNNFLGISTIAIGSLSGISLHIRDVFAHVIAGRAHQFILGHNHPSGDARPSDKDISFTKDVVEACHVMGIDIIDHVIVSSGLTRDTYSFHAHGFFKEKTDATDPAQLQFEFHNPPLLPNVSGT